MLPKKNLDFFFYFTDVVRLQNNDSEEIICAY